MARLADTYVPRRLTITTADDYPAEYTFKLEKGSFIGGYVRDEGGKPVPNVKLSISSSNTVISGQTASVIVRSGETGSVKVGGAGRPLIGQIVLAGEEGSFPLKIRTSSLTLKPSDNPGQKPMDAAAYRDWVEREDVRAQTRAERSYSVLVEADGTFRVEDIPAGTHTLTVTVDPQTSEPRPTTPPQRFTREIVVPEMPGGRSDTPLDLGVLKFQSSKK